MAARRFYDCTVSEKLLHTSFLLLIGVGYLMAMQIFISLYQLWFLKRPS